MDDIKLREKWFYGMGSLGKDFLQSMFTMYLMIFFTDVFGIGAAAAGIILMIARIWDAALNPVIGSTIDRTRTKWGKCRPYIFVMPIPIAVFSVLTFTVPNLDGTAKLAWAAVTYILAGTFFTFYDVALWSMIPSLTTDLKSRGTMIGLARTFTFGALLVVSTLALPSIGILGGGDTKHGYFLFVLILGVISVLFGWLTFFNTKEKVAVQAERPKFKDQIAVISKNKPLYAVIAGVVINNFNAGIGTAVGVYYIIYYLKAPQYISLFMFGGVVAMMVSMSISGTFIKKFGNRKTTIYSLLFSIIPTALMFFVPAFNVMVILILILAANFFAGIPMVSTTGMMAETVDYTELKSGVRADGLLFSFNSFSIQLGSALASGIAGIVLQFVGYVPNSPTQTGTALLWINLLRTLIPAALSILAVLAIRTYPFNKEEYSKISEELQEKHKQA